MKKLIFLFIIILSCKATINKNKVIINDNLTNVILDYIKKNPTHKNLTISKKERTFPSYHIYFGIKDKDTIMAIKLLPHYSNVNIINYEKQGDSIEIFNTINCLGSFMLNQHSIIVFDNKEFSTKFIAKKNLSIKIADSLIFTTNKQNYHIKSKTNQYKIYNDNLLKLE